MRWLVEVTSLGTTEKESLQVDADSWQRALQLARSRRGESNALSGFSIDVLKEGCRAVDPVLRLSYDVRRAPENAASSIRPPAAVPRPQASAPPVAPKVLFKREQDRTPALPLTYREYVYLVQPGTTEAAAEALLRGQLERVQTSLGNVPAGKLVNLAVFDKPFEGKPATPPLATLEWKDWRGAEVVSFPRQAVTATGAPAAGAPTAVAPSAVATTEAATASESAPSADAPEGAIATASPEAVAAASTAASSPVAPAPQATGAVSIAPEVSLQADPFAAPKPPAAEAAAAAPSSSQRRPSSPRWREAGTRLRGEDLLADLFEAMHDLHFLHDAIDGGNFCLAQLMERVPCQVGLVHVFDIDRREFVIANAVGATTNGLLLRRHPESEPMLSRAMRGRKAIVLAQATDSDAASVERYLAVGGAASVIVGPVMQAGRFLGAIELLNPLDGQPFTDVEANAVNYIAEQLAEFISSRGIVTDPERIVARRSG
jgi:hypothetical protein